MYNDIMLYLDNLFTPYFGECCCACWKNRRKYVRLYEEGTERIEKELDLRKLAKNVRNTNILLKHEMTQKDGKPNKQLIEKVKFDNKNVIELDSSEEEAPNDVTKKETLETAGLNPPDTARGGSKLNGIFGNLKPANNHTSITPYTELQKMGELESTIEDAKVMRKSKDSTIVIPEPTRGSPIYNLTKDEEL